jgi:hypothetical protein
VRAASQITSVTPATGLVTGGLAVTLTGVSLSNGTSVTRVLIAGVAAASILSQNATQVIVVTGITTQTVQGGSVAVYSLLTGWATRVGAFNYTIGMKPSPFLSLCVQAPS